MKFEVNKIPNCVLHLLFALGYGITLHAIASELYHKGGYSEILSIQGEYIGMFIIMLSWILIIVKLRNSEKDKHEVQCDRDLL